MYNNHFENLKYFAIGVGTADVFAHHNIINGAPVAIVDQDHGGVTHPSNQVFEFNTVYNARRFYTTESFTSDRRTIMLNAYMSDDLFTALMPGISFSLNCYFNPHTSVSFGYAEAENHGALGGSYDLSGWQTAYGYDMDSVEGDPLFGDPPRDAGFQSVCFRTLRRPGGVDRRAQPADGQRNGFPV